MQTRSSHNWKYKAGTWDSLNTELINFEDDYPVLSSTPLNKGFVIVTCNNYKAFTPESLVSMFVDDNILERFWNKPLYYAERFKKCYAVMTPDFSMLIGMPKPLQMFNVYRNRFIGHVWQQSGVNIVPTICWSDKASFEYCFEGVAAGSVVAVSNTGCRNDTHLRYFDAGYNEMIKRLSPKQIVFQCSKRLITNYSDNNVIFINSFFDLKRNAWEAGTVGV